MVMEMQHTYEKQQSHVDSMIRQVALLTAMMKEIQENRARSKVDENNGEEEGVREAKEERPAYAEEKSEALLEEEEAIECDEEIDNTLFYLQQEEVHEPDEKVERFTTVVKEERTPEERPSPVIDKSEGCGYEEEEPELEGERWRRKAARSIYWVQLQPWPEPQGMGKPPHSGVRPNENKKVQGTYRHHRKKRDAMVTVPQKTQWIEEEESSQGSQVMTVSRKVY